MEDLVISRTLVETLRVLEWAPSAGFPPGVAFRTAPRPALLGPTSCELELSEIGYVLRQKLAGIVDATYSYTS
jgi:hypothetical protein